MSQSLPHNPARVTAQIACEAILNGPDDGYTLRDMTDVFEVATRQRVAPFYVDALVDLIAASVRAAREAQA
jgi:hypothetical protein